MIKDFVKPPLRIFLGFIREQLTSYRLKRTAGSSALAEKLFTDSIISFVKSMQVDYSGFAFRYSANCSAPTLYSSVYACMIYSMLNRLDSYSVQEKNAWADYFDSFQRQDDGLFHDSVVFGREVIEGDWWGGEHLALHIIYAYHALGRRPKHPFYFLKCYYSKQLMIEWLDQLPWTSVEIGNKDADNTIMNVGALLQYQRDFWGDADASTALEVLKEYLLKRINPETGLWGAFDPSDKFQLSRMVQFAYHLMSLFFYDGFFEFQSDRIVNLVLRTQNRLGGFGVQLNSSACEDIDSIDILLRLRPFVSKASAARIDRSIERSYSWVLANQVEDGGMVFRLFEGLTYGHRQMMSKCNQGAMFPTWFRTLSIAYMLRDKNSLFTINRVPGLMF